MTRDLSARRVGVALQATVENNRLCMRNKILRSANANVKSNFSFNEINKKRLTCDICHRVLVSACRFTVFLALLHDFFGFIAWE